MSVSRGKESLFRVRLILTGLLKDEGFPQPPFPGGSVVKNPPASAKDACLDPCTGKNLWRRKWQPTSVFLPGKSHGQRNLAGYSPWGHKTKEKICSFTVLSVQFSSID